MITKYSRRQFLRNICHLSSTTLLARTSIGLAVPLSLNACGGGSSSSTSTSTTPVTGSGASTLPVPALNTGSLVQSGKRIFNLNMQTGSSELVSGLQTSTLGYNGDVLGPTLRMSKGESVQINVTNAIGETTTSHWHGMHVPALMDGGPHQEIVNGTTWAADFDVLNEAATLWYHPHTHGKTGSQVYQGLAGMIIIDDNNSTALNLPSDYGIDDIPVVIQDRRINPDGSLAYLTQNSDRMGMKGDRILANGKEMPRFNAPAQWLRLRLLNGSNARIYNFGFSDNRSFQQIASDGGLLPAPVTLTRLLLSPGERAEIMLDLSQDLNNTLKLVSYSSEVTSMLYAGGGMGGMSGDTLDGTNFDIMTIAIDRPAVNSPSLPAVMNSLPTLTANAPDRLFTLEMMMGQFTINRKAMDLNRIDETVSLGATEIWQVTNNQGMAHPFHIHDEMFQIVSRDGSLPPANEQGWKDTVLVKPNETVRFIVRFSDFSDASNPFMYHCHILEHEDNAMMGQFVVV